MHFCSVNDWMVELAKKNLFVLVTQNYRDVEHYLAQLRSMSTKQEFCLGTFTNDVNFY